MSEIANSKFFFKRPSKLVIGIIFMMVHVVCMSILAVIGKKLLKHSFSPYQVAFLYKVSVLIWILPFCIQKGIKSFAIKRIKLTFLRSAYSVAAQVCFYSALVHVKIIDARAITYLEQGIIVAIGVLYFREPMTFAKITLIVCGIIGASLVIKPGFSDFNIGYLYLFGALALWALNNTTIKILGKTEKTAAQTFFVALFGTLLTLPLIINDSWDHFTTRHIKYVLVFGLIHTIHQVAFFRALKYAEISILMPLEYTGLISSGILAYIYFGETIDTIGLMGCLLIAIGGIFLLYDETKKRGWSRESEEKFIEQKKK